MQSSISSRPQVNSIRELKHPILIQKYNYKFLDYNTPVYTIRSMKETPGHHHAHYKDFQYYTAPLIFRDNSQSENVMISLLCPDQTRHVQIDLQETFDIPTDIMTLTLGELSYHASLLRTPLITIMNSYCFLGVNEKGMKIDKHSEYEIFFTRKYLEYIRDYENRDLHGY